MVGISIATGNVDVCTKDKPDKELLEAAPITPQCHIVTRRHHQPVTWRTALACSLLIASLCQLPTTYAAGNDEGEDTWTSGLGLMIIVGGVAGVLTVIVAVVWVCRQYRASERVEEAQRQAWDRWQNDNNVLTQTPSMVHPASANPYAMQPLPQPQAQIQPQPGGPTVHRFVRDPGVLATLPEPVHVAAQPSWHASNHVAVNVVSSLPSPTAAKGQQQYPTPLANPTVGNGAGAATGVVAAPATGAGAGVATGVDAGAGAAGGNAQIPTQATLLRQNSEQGSGRVLTTMESEASMLDPDKLIQSFTMKEHAKQQEELRRVDSLIDSEVATLDYNLAGQPLATVNEGGEG